MSNRSAFTNNPKNNLLKNKNSTINEIEVNQLKGNTKRNDYSISLA